MPAATVYLDPRSVTVDAARRTVEASTPVRRVTGVGPGGGSPPLAGQFYLFDGSPFYFFDGSPFTFFP